MKKIDVIDVVNNLPSEFDLELLIEKLVLIDKIEEGLKQLENGKTTSNEDVKGLVKKW